MIRITRIDPTHALMAQERDLRQRVMLGPLGITLEQFEKAFPKIEEQSEHYVAVTNHPTGERVVGCVMLLPHKPEPGMGRVLQLAVDPQMQRYGVGRLLLIEVERRAFGELGLTELYCHARAQAAPFYERLGWTPDGEGFEEMGIPHLLMRLRG